MLAKLPQRSHAFAGFVELPKLQCSAVVACSFSPIESMAFLLTGTAEAVVYF